MSTARWEPFSDFDYLRRQIDRLLEDLGRPMMTHRSGTYLLPIDLYQTDHDAVVKAELPGVKPEDISISVTGDMLTIRAERKQEQAEKGEQIYSELPYGSFERSIMLPFPVQADQAQAKFENGELTVTIPKSTAAQPKTIKVQAVQGQQGQQGQLGQQGQQGKQFGRA